MKLFYIFLLMSFYVSGYSQAARPLHKKGKKAKTTKTFNSSLANAPASNDTPQPRQTITEKYLQGDLNETRRTGAASPKNTTGKSPFVGGIKAAPNAGEKFDTTNQDVNSINTVNNTNPTANVTTDPVAAPNDTIFNTNTVTDVGVPTTSGAVDRSGRAQFGQTNWGKSRSTVGEGQWTVPPPITASFAKEFPTAGNTTWTRSNKDTTMYSVRYKTGDNWVTTNYNATGQRLDMRTEVPLVSLPQAVSAYIAKMPANLPVTTVSRWQVLGKADVYEIQTRTGKTIYVNEQGGEVNY